jgi:alpha-glucosidase (family GH31 glycosyl hydrolase)
MCDMKKIMVVLSLVVGFLSTLNAKTCWKDPIEVGDDAFLYKTSIGEVRVDALSDKLFRVRVKRGEFWNESALNRYGVISRNKKSFKSEWKTAKGFKTPSSEILVGEDGSISFKSFISKAKLDSIKLSPNEGKAQKGMSISFPLAKDERIYGIGDVCRTNLMRRGAKYEIWVKNVNSYIPIPMALSHEGWGVLINTTWRNYFDVGFTNPDAMICSAPESNLDFYIFAGANYKCLLDTYTGLTGRPALLPIWGYGFTYVCNDTIDDFGVCAEASQFRDRKFPCDVIGLEPGWMETNYDSTTRKKWHPKRFTWRYWSPRNNFSSALRRMGFKLSLWLCCNYDLFRYEEQLVAGEAKKMGRKVELPEGISETWHDDRAETGSKALKSTSQTAYEEQFKEGDLPWFEHLKKFVDQGAQCFKLDASYQVTERPTFIYANGMNDEEAHNVYSVVYAKQMSRGFEDHTKKRSMVYSAGGYAGVQQYVATWAGDTGGGEKPCASLLNLAFSGHSNQSCDMNIFSPASLHFGFLQTWSQQNNWAYWFQPWYQPEENQKIFREYGKLRYRLLPYLYTMAANAHLTGYPVVRALAMVYPDVVEYDNYKTTYMLGDNLLVGAFQKEIQIPEGIWYEWRTGEKVVGPCKKPVKITPEWGGALYVKAGAVIPMWKEGLLSVSRGWNKDIEYHVWPGADSENYLYEDDGTTLEHREGKYAKTPLVVKGDTLTIGKRVGSFSGMPNTYNIKIVVHEGGNSREIDLGEVGTDEKVVNLSVKK